MHIGGGKIAMVVVLLILFFFGMADAADNSRTQQHGSTLFLNNNSTTRGNTSYCLSNDDCAPLGAGHYCDLANDCRPCDFFCYNWTTTTGVNPGFSLEGRCPEACCGWNSSRFGKEEAVPDNNGAVEFIEGPCDSQSENYTIFLAYFKRDTQREDQFSGNLTTLLDEGVQLVCDVKTYANETGVFPSKVARVHCDILTQPCQKTTATVVVIAYDNNTHQTVKLGQHYYEMNTNSDSCTKDSRDLVVILLICGGVAVALGFVLVALRRHMRNRAESESAYLMDGVGDDVRPVAVPKRNQQEKMSSV